MIQPLRGRHRAAWIVLALALPALVAWGLAARRAVPASDGLPAALAAVGFEAGDVLFSQQRRVPGRIAMAVRHLRSASAAGSPRLALELIDDPRRPELLAYWSAGAGSPSAQIDDARLPGDALLLGRLELGRSVIVDLPDVARDVPGRLVIYSLAQSEVVDVFNLATGTEPP